MGDSEGGAGSGAGLADAVLLAPLTEDTFLHNLHVRYKRDIIYTYVGNALVSVNPSRALPLYSAELVRAYLARPPYQLPPHLYAITASAYRWVRDRHSSQVVVVTGESGAGKTEAARVCLQCVVLAGDAGDGGHAAGTGAGAGAGARLTAAGTLLEAFGNAATARNHNASRFGKLLDVEFDFKGAPVGGHITHYLLEKERVRGPADGERNFHVLYQLLAGADAHLLKRLKLQRSWEQYRILRGGTEPIAVAGAAPGSCSPRRPPPAGTPPPGARPPAADREHFAFTKAAMNTLGFGGAVCGGVLRVLAFILKLGNVEFEPHHNIDGTIGARLQHHYELTEACSVVGVCSTALTSALVGAGAGEGRGEEEEELPAADWAAALRDRILHAVYARLFTWLVNEVNVVIAGGSGGRGCTLGILDVYGFESLAHNGLERLLINYAAERLQAAVTAATLCLEQEDYKQEGLQWTTLQYCDHELGAELLDLGPDSVLGALRDATLRAAGDVGLLQRLQRRRHPRLTLLPPDHFQVVHFAGAVTYNARGMVSHNRDAVCRRACAALGGAREPLLAALFARAPGSPRARASLACRQRALLAALLRRLPAAPRLVRCLRPDRLLRPHRFDAPLDNGYGTVAARGMVRVHAGACSALAIRDAAGRRCGARGALGGGAGAGGGGGARRQGLAAGAAYPQRGVCVRQDQGVHPEPPHGVGARSFASGARVGVGECRATRVEKTPRAPARRTPETRAVRYRTRVEGLSRDARSPGARGAASRAGAGRRGRALLGGGRAVARVGGRGAATLSAGAGAAAAGAAPLARAGRVASVPAAGAAGAHGRAVAPLAPPLALQTLPRRVRPDRPKPHARESHCQRALQGPQADVPAQRGAPVRGRLRAPARVGGVAPRAGRRARRPLRRLRGRRRQGGTVVGARGALPVRGVDGRAAAAGAALAAAQATRARARRVPPVAVAAGRRRAGGARARARARRRRARLSAGRRAAPRRPGAAHVPRAGAGHQTVPGGAERGGRAAASQHRARVRRGLRPADGDGGVPRAQRGRSARAATAPRQSPRRAAMMSSYPVLLYIAFSFTF